MTHVHTCWLLSRPAPVPPTPSRALPTRAARKWLARGPRVCRATGQPCGCWPALRDGVVLPFRPTPTQSDVICAAGPRARRAAPRRSQWRWWSWRRALLSIASTLATATFPTPALPHDRGAAVARRNDSCSLRNFLKQINTAAARTCFWRGVLALVVVVAVAILAARRASQHTGYRHAAYAAHASRRRRLDQEGRLPPNQTDAIAP